MTAESSDADRHALISHPRPPMTQQTLKHRPAPDTPAPQRGQAILELAVVLPVLIFIFFSIIDIGQMINQYLSITEVAYEGARYGASLPGLPPVPGQNDSSAQSCSKIRERVYEVLEDNGYLNPRSNCEVSVAYEPPDPANPQAAGHSVHVTVRVPFHPFLNLYSGVHVTVTATAPYLFKDTNVATQGLQTIC